MLMPLTRHNADVNDKRQALKLIRATYPDAVAALFETSDQGHYGFVLQAVELPGETYADHDHRFAYDVNDLIGDLDWDDVMDESPQGYTRVEIASAYITVSMDIDNAYVTGQDLTRVADVLVPVPPATERTEDDEAWNDWAQVALFPYTGTGVADGESSYRVRITASEAAQLVGREFDF